jgi:DNA (cytosine-5)-methyltransferase 1
VRDESREPTKRKCNGDPLATASVRCAAVRLLGSRGRGRSAVCGSPLPAVLNRRQAHGPRDERNLFAEVARAIHVLKPKVVLVENVLGLLRPGFQQYFEGFRSGLARGFYRNPPSRPSRDLTSRNSSAPPTYSVHVHSINAADYGVPQWRNRVIIIDFRKDLGIVWRPPEPTHSCEALLSDQWMTKASWRRHGLSPVRHRVMSARLEARYRSFRRVNAGPVPLLPWATVRDALLGLGRPVRHDDCFGHYTKLGARPYTGHLAVACSMSQRRR